MQDIMTGVKTPWTIIEALNSDQSAEWKKSTLEEWLLLITHETYDWVDIHHTLKVRGGRSVVAPEWTAAAAHEMAQRAGFDASPTGSAGLAGLLAALGPERNDLPTSANVVVVMSGVTR